MSRGKNRNKKEKRKTDPFLFRKGVTRRGDPAAVPPSTAFLSLQNVGDSPLSNSIPLTRLGAVIFFSPLYKRLLGARNGEK